MSSANCPHLSAAEVDLEVVHLLIGIAAAFHDYEGEDEIRERAALNACRLIAAHRFIITDAATKKRRVLVRTPGVQLTR